MATDYLRAARELWPLIDQHAAAGDGAPMSRESVDALAAAGLFGVMRPREVGGAELSLLDALDVFAEGARADGSAGWCLMAGASAVAYFGAYCPEAVRSRPRRRGAASDRSRHARRRRHRPGRLPARGHQRPAPGAAGTLLPRHPRGQPTLLREPDADVGLRPRRGGGRGRGGAPGVRGPGLRAGSGEQRACRPLTAGPGRRSTWTDTAPRGA
jgi:hypothetical protein